MVNYVLCFSFTCFICSLSKIGALSKLVVPKDVQAIMSSNIYASNRKDTVYHQSSELASRSNVETSSVSTSAKDDLDYSVDEETMGLYSRARAQQEEIMLLREQIALASIRQSQLMNEKNALEKKFAELRMALDEQQNESIASASNELARRKIPLEENVKLTHELKAVEDEQYIFMTSLLRLLGEYGMWPRVTNAYALTSSIKNLHDQLQLKIRSTHTRISELNPMMESNGRGGPFDKENPTISGVTGQGIQKFPPYVDGPSLGAVVGASRYGHENHPQTRSLTLQHEDHVMNKDDLLKPSLESDRDFAGPVFQDPFFRSGVPVKSEERIVENVYNSPRGHNGFGPFDAEEEIPGIEGFQIIGDAKPGNRLLGCGFPVQGTTLCMFQWVRHYPDGTREYIDGATNPEYVVTADDVDKVIAVECIPMDDQGHQGELVRIFANDSSKITCDPDMQIEIDSYVSQGQAVFNLHVLTDSDENWEPATLTLKRSNFLVKLYKTEAVMLAEKFSKDLSIMIPGGLSSQFVLTCADGSSHPFSTNNDIRMRDTLVLTMRIFLSKALDEKRRVKE
ncbi:hypothetical protein Leryth_023192 [Lithospermum erythrorhizon]|nr:hypothetical protein Leryth_023192 [Lithospermum erythrorhizon]